MQQQKTISISMLAASLLVLAGCSSNPVATHDDLDSKTNVSTNTDTNEVVNENTNVMVDGEVDTSDWQTYTNDEYGFSLRYPSHYSYDESDSEINFTNTSIGVTQANQENIKFLLQPYDEAPEQQGETHAFLYTKSQLSSLKESMQQDANSVVNEIPMNIGYNYDVSGGAFYREAAFFIGSNYVSASIVIMPENVVYPNHAFNDETGVWVKDVMAQLDSGQLLSPNDQDRLDVFNAIIQSIQIN